MKKRIQTYIAAIKVMQEYNVSLGAAKRFLKEGTFPPWPDSESPTGWSQKCNWRGNCQYPCNGDC